jgi:hypothetical protein
MLNETTSPYAVPAILGPALSRVLAYWRGLKRGGNDIPFWDDVRIADLTELADRVALIEVFELPERFRFELVGRQLEQSQPAPITGKFLDEIELGQPLELLRAQCAATVEQRGPTYVDVAPIAAGASERARLVMPLWGEGQIRMLLVAVA